MFVAFICELPAAQESGGEPADLQDITLRAEAARKDGRSQDAEALYRRGLENNPRWADGWWLLGLLLYDQSRYPEAETAIKNFMGLQSGVGAGLCPAGSVHVPCGEI